MVDKQGDRRVEMVLPERTVQEGDSASASAFSGKCTKVSFCFQKPLPQAKHGSLSCYPSTWEAGAEDNKSKATLVTP